MAKFLTKNELLFIKKFYDHFEGKYSSLVDDTLTGYSKVISKTKKSLGARKVLSYMNNVSKFFNVKDDLKYEVLFVWWPPVRSSRANPSGRFLVMKNNPKTH